MKTTTQTDNRQVDSIGIRMGERWATVPIERQAFRAFRDELLNEWKEVEGWTSTDSRRLEVMLSKIRSDLGQSGVQFAAFFVDGASNEASPSNEDITALMATLTFSVHSRTELKSELALTPELLFAAFAQQAKGEVNSKGFRVSDLEPPRLTDLNIGRATHLRRLYEPAKMLSTTPSFFSESFIFSMGASHEACGVLQFSTVNLPEAQQFSQIFNTIANTATLFADGDETIYNDQREKGVTT